MDTAATGIIVPSSADTAALTMSWYTQIAPVVMVPGSISSASKISFRTGNFAFWHNRRTRSSVSSPDRVVKSIQVIALSNHAA